MLEIQKLVKISDIVQNQIPEFVLEDNENLVEFFKQYYYSQEYQGGVVNLTENLTTYKNFSAFDSTNLIASTTLSEDIDFFDDTIYVESTKGWPEIYGLLKINDEIITYTGITTNSFTGCIRGFSGVDSLRDESNPELLVFKSTEANAHSSDDVVNNLSNLFLIEFFKKQKSLYFPGFEEVDFDSKINPQNFLSNAKTFYQSKGTDESYKILFKVLYNENVQIIKPREYCFTPSDDKWVVTETFICDLVEGDPFKVSGQTLYQDPDPYNDKIEFANGSIYSVDSYLLNNRSLYKIRIFAGYSNNLNPKGSIFGSFIPTFKTFVVENVESGSNTIFVDSTVGFPTSGVIYIGENIYTYTDKTINQFLNVSTQNSTLINNSIEIGSRVYSTNYVYSYEDGDNTKKVSFRINNVLSSFESVTSLYALEGDPIKVDNVGHVDNNIFVKSLKFNHPISIYSGVGVTAITTGVRYYSKQGFAINNGLSLSKYEHNLKNGDILDLYVKFLGTYQLYLPNLQVTTSLSKEFSTQQIEDTSLLGKEIIFKRRLKKTKATPFTKLFNNINNRYTANIQDAYADSNYNYIASNGLPDYEVNPYVKDFTLNANIDNSYSLVGSHNFYTGESVKVVGYGTSGTLTNDFIKAVGFNTGNTYYVNRIGPSNLRLAETRENLGVGGTHINLLELTNVGNVSGYFVDIVLQSSPIYGNNFSTTKTFKKIPKFPTFEKDKISTQPGPVGIFANGIEIQSYKSFDKVFYGKIENVDILNGGEGYSLINPPRFEIFNASNDQDSLTILIPEMEGSLVGFKIVNPGYNYESEPTVTVSGGNVKDVPTRVKMKYIDNEIEFNSTTRASVVRTITNDFRFEKNHGFTEGEAVVYETNNTFPIGIGTIVSDGTLLDQSVYYVSEVGAGTSFRLALSKNDALIKNNLINIRTTGGGVQKFRSLEKIQVIDKVNIVGIVSGFKYKKLSFGVEDINVYDNIFYFNDHGYQNGEEVIITQIGTPLDGATPGQIYYIDKLDNNSFRLSTNIQRTNILNIISLDFATTYFIQYPPIEVQVNGRFKKTSSSIVGYGATIIPIVDGYVKSLKVQRGLASPATVTLGVKNIVNYQKKPRISVLEGENAEFQPQVEDGKITKVIVKNAGENYFNDFDLIISGQGYGANITAVTNSGQITDVKIINGGVGYASSDTSIQIINKGKDLLVSAEITSWTLNEVAKLGTSNLSNGYLFGSKYSKFGNTFGVFFLDSNLINTFGIISTKHSPIIGWAYDGCPIYGPYAYENTDGSGNVIRMLSGYVRNKISPHPTLDAIEDYTFTNSGTLDENNGRFAITPEYPRGIYAYYCTIDSSGNPVFPYVIGNTYNYIPEGSNFILTQNQDLDFNELGIVKYTKPYRVDDKEHYYEYFENVISENRIDAIVTSVSTGKINSIDVVDGGTDYEIGDRIEFYDSDLGGLGAVAEVSKISGVGIVTISAGITTFNDVKFVSIESGILGIATTAHNFKSQTFINISGISTTDYSELEGFRRINVEYPSTILTESLSNAATTGIVTSIKIKSPVLGYRVDDQLTIGTETLTVVGVDKLNNRLNVLRQSGSPGYAISSTVSDFVTKFTFSYPKLSLPLTELDDSYYFNPSQSVSVGISSSAGVGNTLTVSPLGYGVSITKYIEHGGIFLPFNPFRDGEKVIYTTNASTIVSNAGPLVDLPSLYIVKISPDIVGLVQDIKDVKNKDALLKYNAVGTGNLHKFKTQRNIVTGSATQINVNVSAASSHGLDVDNNIEFNVTSGVTTTYVVGYGASSKRVLIDGQINPRIRSYANESVVFSLTDPSISGKDFNLYSDDIFRNPYFGNEEGIEVIKTETELTLQITEFTPKLLYYNLTNITTDDEIYQDLTIKNNNQLKIEDSVYNLQSKVIGVTSTTFVYNLPTFPERPSYTSVLSDLSYNVLDVGIKGPISSVRLLYGGSNYQKLPEIKNIITDSGKGVNLYPKTTSIGKIKSIDIVNKESVYSSDKTLSPISTLFTAIRTKNNYKVSKLEILEPGRKYLYPPTLILFNKVTGSIDSLFSAAVTLKSQSIDSVTIVDSSSNLKSTDNTIISINNSNGIKILSASVSGAGPYDVDLTLQTPLSGFSTSNPLPIEIGDEIFIESIISSGGSGFNSSDYNYETFTVTFTNPNFSAPDAAIVRYQTTEFPGVFNSSTYNAIVCKYDDLVKVSATLEKSSFTNNEEVSGNKIIDNDKNEPILEVLKFDSASNVSKGDLISGKISLSKAEVQSIEIFDADLKVNSSVTEKIGWRDFRGNLSSILQKLQDNDYYQNFAYSLKSNKSIDEWGAIVSDVAHVSGYKQFGDLLVESELPVGIAKTLTVTSDATSLVNVALVSETDVTSVSNFDMVIEEDIDDTDGLYSEYLKFGTKKLSDYLLSRNNRVLSIDDISNLFDTDNSPFVTIPIDTVNTNNEIVLKYFFFVGTTISFFGDFEKPQVFDLMVTRTDNIINLTSYAYYYDFYTASGSINFPSGEISATVDSTDTDNIIINFVPRNIFNSYAIRAIKDSAPVSVGIATTSYGYVCNIEKTVQYPSTMSPTAEIIYSYPLSDLTSGIGFIGVSSSPKKMRNSFEFSFIKDVGNNIDYNVFAEQKTLELGSFDIGVSGSDVQFKFTPVSGIGITVHTNFQILNTNNVSPNQVINELTVLTSEKYIYNGSSQVSISTVSSDFCSTKYIIEAEKTVGLATSRSIFQINSVHFEDYNNNTVYGFAGDMDSEEFAIETIYNPSPGEYLLAFTPSESANYNFKIVRKSILSPNT